VAANNIPEIIRFEGHNFDIIAEITALLIALIAFRKIKPKKHCYGFGILCLLFF
jgi:hypothetical protein